MRPACSNEDAAQLDSTRGLRASGAYRLEADCAETATTSVDGVEAFWIRGRLEETLPADPARVLPEVESIRLSTQVARSYAAIWQPSARFCAGRRRPARRRRCSVRVLDAAGVPLAGVQAAVLETGDSDLTEADGTVSLDAVEDAVNTVLIGLDTVEQSEPVETKDAPVEVTFTLDMTALEKAVVDGTEVDLSKPFFPFGLQPQPGAALYLSHDEAFAKPGARLRFYVQPTVTPQDASRRRARRHRMAHVVSWEYWNGRAWASLLSAARRNDKGADDLRARGIIELTVPDDMAPTDRRRRGGPVDAGPAGQRRLRRNADDHGHVARPVSFFVPQPPALADLRLGYTWQDGPIPPERVLAYNDFRYEDRTARRSGRASRSSRSRRSPTRPPASTSASTGRCRSTASASSSTSRSSPARWTARRWSGSTGTASTGGGWRSTTRPRPARAGDRSLHRARTTSARWRASEPSATGCAPA